MTSPYQTEPANSAAKLRFSSGRLAEPASRDRPLCCSSRCTAERDRLWLATVPAASSSRTIWRTERRGLSRLARSEEHTSELQSRVDLVCRLLLEKKKT